MKVFFLILFCLFFVPFVNLATADHTGDYVTSFVQIFHRDNDGNLIGYLEYTNHVLIQNALAFEHLLTYQSNTVSLVEVDGKQFELIGSKEEDEEKYLELTSDVAPHKRYFINFNGAPMSEVIFWDILVYLEAMRTYVKLMKNKTEDAEMKKKFQILLDVQEQNPQVFFFCFHVLSYFFTFRQHFDNLVKKG